MDGASVQWKFHDPIFNQFCMIHLCDRRTDDSIERTKDMLYVVAR